MPFNHWTHGSFILTLESEGLSISKDGKGMKTSTHPIGRRLKAIRHDFRGDRDARLARKTLQRELSSYTSPSELNDLEAILDRYSDEETADIRRFLATRRVA
jgi:hypothetical protein